MSQMLSMSSHVAEVADVAVDADAVRMTPKSSLQLMSPRTL
jgi:hypothetical protein